MRNVRAGDYFRHVFEKEQLSRLIHIKLEGEKGFSFNQMTLQPGLNALVGRNGSGKSTVLKAMYDFIKTDSNIIHFKNVIDENFKLVGCVRINGQNYEDVVISKKDFDNSGISRQNISAFYIDTVNEVMLQQQYLLDFSIDDLQEILDTKEGYSLSSKDIGEISQIVGKSYSEIMCYEIDDFEKDDSGMDDNNEIIVPYFIVKDTSGLNYSSRNMGQGEFLIFYIWWFLRKFVPAKSLVFIEEPENLLFPGAQMGLLNFMLMISGKNNLSITITTHSEHLLRKLPNSNVFILSRSGSHIEHTTASMNKFYLEYYGIISEPQNYLFVEDLGSKYFCENLLSEIRPELKKIYNIVPFPGGADLMVKSLKGLMATDVKFSFFGLLDADKYNEYFSKETPEGFLSIPGFKDPDYDIKNICYKRREDLHEYLQYDQPKLNHILDCTETIDHHDWLETFSNMTGMGIDQLRLKLTKLLMTDSAFAGQLDSFICKLENA